MWNRHSLRFLLAAMIGLLLGLALACGYLWPRLSDADHQVHATMMSARKGAESAQAELSRMSEELAGLRKRFDDLKRAPDKRLFGTWQSDKERTTEELKRVKQQDEKQLASLI